MACEQYFSLRHFDIKQAFVQSDLDEFVFMRLPEGCGRLSGMIVKLNKSLYGLKQASRQWHSHLVRCLICLGFIQCLADTCVFRLIEEGRVVVTLAVHVDDIFSIGEEERCDQFGRDLNTMVPVKNLGDLRWYSGCFYERDWDAGSLKISQQTYAEELGMEFGVEYGKEIPLPVGLKLSEFDQDEEVVSWPFRELIGSLMWLATQTRPDIANANCVTFSTTEAEYVSLADVMKEVLFLRQVWHFMLPEAGMPCIPVFEDNQGAIQLAQNPISNSNSKHIDLRHHFIRELVGRKEISIFTWNQCINMLTSSRRHLTSEILSFIVLS
ncbi:unnamed protein product [Ectocarpus sp. CCAP 1310/34]|nr:unnamed protein product [Ectocarpus sp. CCAP 1310/34]